MILFMKGNQRKGGNEKSRDIAGASRVLLPILYRLDLIKLLVVQHILRAMTDTNMRQATLYISI
jgi:hypothetical protein